MTLDVLDASLVSLDDIQRRIRGCQSEIAAILADTRWQAAAVAAYRRNAAAVGQRLGLVASGIADAREGVAGMRAHLAAIGAG